MSMLTTLLAVLLSSVAFAQTALSAEAHGGDLDVFGCHYHYVRYHCHEGQLSGQHFASQKEMFAALEPGWREPSQEQNTLRRQKATSETCIKEYRTAKVFCGDVVPGVK